MPSDSFPGRHTPSSTQRIARRKALGAVTLVLFGTSQLSCRSPAHEIESRDALHELARAGIGRRVQPLLSIPLQYGPCTARTAPDETIPRTDCQRGSTRSADRAGAIGARAAAAVEAAGDPRAMHAVALVDLLWADDEGISLHWSITYLQTVARTSERPGPALADLAAAYLVRAERTQNARDLMEALEVADSAAELEPQNAAARFNLALALDRLGLDGEAVRAWKEFLMLDSTSAWAGEARERVRALEAAPAQPMLPPTDTAHAEAAAYAARSPQEARLLGWDHLLGEWGDAFLRGDAVTAESRLRLAGALGEALERRGGDATLVDAVRAIRARAADPVAARTLARAHREFAAGRRAFSDVDYEAAGAHFAAVLALRPASGPLVDWALMFRSATLVYDGRLPDAEAILQPLWNRTDTVRHAALGGRIRGALATTQLRSGRLEDALDASRESIRLLERAGETEHLGGALYLAADAEFALGASTAAYTSIFRALATLRPYRRSVWLCNLLSAAARTTATDGLVRASRRFQDERVRVAERNGQPLYRAEARLARAQVLTTLGRHTAAATDIRDGESLVGRIKPRFIRNWIIVDLRLARAATSLRSRPAEAAVVLDSVFDRPNGTLIPIRLLRALLARAEARLALGDEPGATSDLDRAIAVLELQRAEILRAPLRASILDSGRAVFDRLIMLRLAAGDTATALSYLERSRTSFAPAVEGGPNSRRPRPPSEAAVEYALIGDTLLIWTVTATGARLTRDTVNRARLAQTVERTRSLLEVRAREDAVRPGLTELYDRLIRPIRQRLGKEGTLVVLLADGEVAGVPFAALYDSVRGRYLVQDHPLRFGPSRSERGRLNPTSEAPPRVLLIADPAFDRRKHPGLRRLRGARAEVDSIRHFYPGAEVLADSQATGDTLAGALRHAAIVHFAGHAVFDDRRPDQSYLVTAAQSDGSGKLSASDLEAMDLRHVRLVVLSACQTLRAHGGRSGGFAGFAGALLAAGAGGTVGSLWEVEDQLTRELMVAFHDAYARSGDGPSALRAAQLALLRSPDPAHRSPAAWAGFRYAGH